MPEELLNRNTRMPGEFENRTDMPEELLNINTNNVFDRGNGSENNNVFENAQEYLNNNRLPRWLLKFIKKET